MRLGLSYSFVWLSMPVETGPLSALPIRSGQRDLFEVVGLLLELHGDVLQRRSVFARVVGTKQQFAPGREHGT